MPVKKKGRPRKEISEAKLDEQIKAYRAGKIKANEAAEAISISRRTFFRRVKEART